MGADPYISGILVQTVGKRSNKSCLIMDSSFAPLPVLATEAWKGRGRTACPSFRNYFLRTRYFPWPFSDEAATMLLIKSPCASDTSADFDFT